VVEMMESVLPGLGLSKRAEVFLRRALQRQGIEVRVQTKALGLSKNGLLVRGDQDEEIEGEVIVVAVGRRPNSQGLGVEDVGIRLEKGFVCTDENFQAAPGIYAIGDLRGGPLLAHKASHEGLVLAEHLWAKLGGKAPAKADVPRVIPWAVFTFPEVAMVGAPVETPGLKVVNFPFAALGRAQAEGEPQGFVSLACDENGKIAGAEIIGPHASELIAEVALAMELGIPVAELAKVVHAHPTFSEAIWEAALLALGRPLHTL